MSRYKDQAGYLNISVYTKSCEMSPRHADGTITPPRDKEARSCEGSGEHLIENITSRSSAE